ncbi:N-glycosylase/DNA lyase [Onthophagus taurus]|uniref:N-glycosylase/DNA lyase n=1 Tax=Onthophagus taurus TaxID=166361 RepID=UPI000C20790C|nr:N-glycosylase/DNA lyase [Onthophagus taurus]XP_022913871.1 N-glycosylase/DNA lyase [Onthophagus taurus]
MASKWYNLAVKKTDLQLLGTLNGGQSFRWKLDNSGNKEQWIGIFDHKLWILEQENDAIKYQVYGDEENVNENEKEYSKLLKNYFNLDINLQEYYKQWSDADPYFKKASKQFYGIRILKQDITENIFSFICSSNNNISRITSMIEKLATFYGNKICTLNDTTYYSFPTINNLCVENVEKKLSENGFGYRAKYISKTAKFINENGGDLWLEKLKEMKYMDARKNLMNLSGVGPKVADCICLMSLGHLEAVPVDTHVYQIATRLYLPKLGNKKTVTEKVYQEIGECFRNMYGPLAGWAHTILFCADLKKFQQNQDENSEPITKRKKK